MFIVKITPDYYIAEMGLTQVRNHAKQFKTEKGAKISLATYRTRRDYPFATIIPA